MEASHLITFCAAALAAWVALAAPVAVVLGRTAAAGEHERTIDSLRREVWHA